MSKSAKVVLASLAFDQAPVDIKRIDRHVDAFRTVVYPEDPSTLQQRLIGISCNLMHGSGDRSSQQLRTRSLAARLYLSRPAWLTTSRNGDSR